MNMVRRVSNFFTGSSSKPNISDPQLISVNEKPVLPGPPPPPPPPVNVKITKVTPNSSSKKSRQSVLSPPVSSKSVNSVSNDNDSDISDLSDEEYGTTNSTKSRKQSTFSSNKSPSIKLSHQANIPLPPPPVKSPVTINDAITSSQQVPFSSSKSTPTPIAPSSNENTLEFIHLVAFRGDIHTMRQLLSDSPDAVNKKYDYMNNPNKKLLTTDELNNPAYRPPPPLPALVRNALQVKTSELKLDDRWILSEFFGSSTLMHYACAGNQLQMVQLLLTFGSNSHTLNKVGREPDYYTSLDTIQNLLGNQQVSDIHLQNEVSNIPFANVRDEKVEKEKEEKKVEEQTPIPPAPIVSAPTGPSVHEEFMKAAVVEADSYVEAWEKKEKPVYSIDQTIDSNVYAESFIVREKVPEKKQIEEKSESQQSKIKKVAEPVIFPDGSSLKKVVDSLAPLKFPQAKEFMSSEDIAAGKVMYIQYKPEMELVGDRMTSSSAVTATKKNSTTVASSDVLNYSSTIGATAAATTSSRDNTPRKKGSKNKVQNPNSVLWHGVANSLKEDSSFRAVRLDALSYGQQLLHKEFKNLGLTDNWEGLQVGVSQKNNIVTDAAAENIETGTD